MNELLSEALKTGKGVELGEALGIGGMVTVVGLAIVFGVLIILMLVLMLFKVIFYKEPKKAETKQPKQEVKAPTPVPAPAQQTDDTELIAVLTAAVAASLNTSTYNLRIKSYRRVDGSASAWTRSGIRENTINKTY